MSTTEGCHSNRHWDAGETKREISTTTRAVYVGDRKLGEEDKMIERGSQIGRLVRQ